jgi:glutathione S-transferase
LRHDPSVMADPSHTLIVGVLSPFSDKAQGIFRYKGIPFTRVEVNPRVTAEILVPKTGRHLIPGLIKPDGTGLGDSTAIAHYADALRPDPPLLPREPRLEFLTHLLEDYFDEWLTKVMFCLRWTFPADGERAADVFARTMATDELPAEQLREAIPQHLRKQMHFLVGGPQNTPFFESEFKRIYMALDPHFAAHAYLFGPRPTLADFALWGQSKQMLDDPTAGSWMRRDHPHVAAWVEKITAGSPERDARAAGDWIDPGLLAELYRRIEATYFPWVMGNRRALAAGEKTFRFERDGFTIDFPAGGYLEKCFAAVEARRKALCAEDRAAVDRVIQWPS